MTPPPHSPPKIHPSCRREASLLGTKDEKDATNPAALLILERENNSIIFPGVQQYALFCIIPIGQKALKQEESKDQSEKIIYLFCRMASVSPWSRRVQGSNREFQSRIKSRSPILDQTEKSKCSLVYTKSDVGNFFRVIDISGLGRSSNWRTFGWLLIRGGRPALLKRKVNMSCVVWWLMVEASLMWLLSFLPQESQSTARKLGGGHPSIQVHVYLLLPFKYTMSRTHDFVNFSMGKHFGLIFFHTKCSIFPTKISGMIRCDPIDTVALVWAGKLLELLNVKVGTFVTNFVFVSGSNFLGP